MAGFIFSLSSDLNAMESIINSGVYSTFINTPKNSRWSTAIESTFGDYITMKENDYVFFFSNRIIYGVGKLSKVGRSCIYKNYPCSIKPHPSNTHNALLKVIDKENEDTTIHYRWLCTFVPDTLFFKKGVDIDDVLSSSFNKFRILRTFENRSFIKIDDVEASALRDMILFKNRDYLDTFNSKYHYVYDKDTHENIKGIITKEHNMSSEEMLEVASSSNPTKPHEMAIELNILEKINNEEKTPFGKWDYISHQVVASPFKPIGYSDKMDLFGYKYLKGTKTISDFLVGEVKRDTITKEDVSQVMKYVDWVYTEYASRDYSRIKAYLIGYDYEKDALDCIEEIVTRQFRVSSRPPIAGKWDDLTFIKYRYNNGNLNLTKIID